MDLFRPNDSFVTTCKLHQTEYADALRFSLVGITGSACAFISITCNVIVLYVFSTSRRLRRQNYANPVVLAGFDLIVSVCFIFIQVVQICAFYYQNVTVIKIWVAYVRYAHCLQAHLLVFMVRNKVFVLMFFVLLAIMVKGTMLFETSIRILSNCESLDRYAPVQTSYLDTFSTVRFWIRRMSTVLLPFCVLFYCNCQIVCKLETRRQQTQKASIKKSSLRDSLTNSSIRKLHLEKKGVRTATRTLVLVVGCYLLSNFLSCVLGFWEHFNLAFFQRNYYKFLVVSDIASLLTVLGCALRLPIYCASDRRIRKAVGRCFIRCCTRALPLEVPQAHLDKWSLVVVSNSLRSNLTGQALQSQDFIGTGVKAKRAREELAYLLHNRRRIIVDMTLRMAKETFEEETGELWLTSIQEDESTTMEHKKHKFRAQLSQL